MASSYARTQTRMNAQLSVLAQAKPAIISASNSNGYDSFTSDALSEKIQSALKLSPKCEDSKQVNGNRFEFDQKMKLVEDETAMQRQNISNQMRQAAVNAAASSSQQKVRLSATERLAMTAKRPMTTQQSQLQLRQPPVNGANLQSQPQQQSMSSTKSAPMPTLETLLAVQRQLQKHTRQNLNSVPQESVKQKQQETVSFTAPSSTNSTKTTTTTSSTLTSSVSSGISKAPSPPPITSTNGMINGCTSVSGGAQLQRVHKPLPPPPPSEPSTQQIASEQQQHHQHHLLMNHYHNNTIETYDKDLPPLPASISPSTSTDDSQMNSLESHQSSPATSLVSLPPPPPPISSYLQHYDDAANNNCHHSNSSTPSTTVSSDISSVRYFPPVPVKMINQQQSHNQEKSPNLSDSSKTFELPSLFKNQSPRLAPSTCGQSHSSAPAVAPKPTNLQAVTAAQTNDSMNNISSQKLNANILSRPQRVSYPQQPQVIDNASVASQQKQNESLVKQQHNHQQHQAASLPYTTHQSSSQSNHMQQQSHHQIPPISTHKSQQSQQSVRLTRAQFSNSQLSSYQQHVFTPQTSSYSGHFRPSSLLPPPPPPPTMQAPPKTEVTGGFDEPDNGSFRFPTPPPREMLLDEDEDEDENEDDARKDGEDEEDDDDFHCKIPTPPAHESMSAATFQNFHCQQSNGIKANGLQPSMSSMFTSSTFTATIPNGIQPPVFFRQQQSHQNNRPQPQMDQQIKPNPQLPSLPPPQMQHTSSAQQQQQPRPPPPQTTTAMPPQLTVHINNEGGLLSTANPTNHHLHHRHLNHRHHHHHNQRSSVDDHIIMTMAASSSSPSSSSDGDGQSNSSSSTSGIHSSIDSPSSSNSKLDDFNYSAGKLKQPIHELHQSSGNFNNNFKKVTSSALLASGVTNGAAAAVTGVFPTKTNATNTSTVANAVGAAAKPRPALKQKKSVSFSDKVELVACADEQSEDHLPNPLLARVLAGKLQ